MFIKQRGKESSVAQSINYLINKYFLRKQILSLESLSRSRTFLFGDYNDYRSSHRRCSVRKGVPRNFAKFTVKHLW